MKTIFNQKTALSFLLLFSLTLSVSMAQTDDVVIMDSGYSQKQEIINQLPSNIAILEINRENNPWKTIREYLLANTSVQNIHLFANASYNAFELGGITYNSEQVNQEFEFSMLEGLYQGTNIQLLVYDCNLGSNEEGLALLKRISERSYFNIGIPTNCNSVLDGDLDFDHTTMNQPINSSIFN
ncbi:MAG TPA: DUF4347 domain-containing protein [Allomuricauda sp.]|nr:DUF4347 domain-containing protein [Allomuricauda sp.]